MKGDAFSVKKNFMHFVALKTFLSCEKLRKFFQAVHEKGKGMNSLNCLSHSCPIAKWLNIGKGGNRVYVFFINVRRLYDCMKLKGQMEAEQRVGGEIDGDVCGACDGGIPLIINALIIITLCDSCLERRIQ